MILPSFLGGAFIPYFDDEQAIKPYRFIEPLYLVVISCWVGLQITVLGSLHKGLVLGLSEFYQNINTIWKDPTTSISRRNASSSGASPSNPF
jgi:hypothetical protein